MNEIISKWVVNYKNWNIGITSDNRVFCLKTKTELVEYWNNGTISYRYPRSTRRIGVKTINKHCEKKRVVLQDNIPF